MNIDLIISNPPYGITKIHTKIANLFKEKYRCVFVMPFSMYTHIKNNDMPVVCDLLNHGKVFDDCKSVANICIVGYNIEKQEYNILTRVLQKYVKYFTDSIANHFHDEKKYKLYLKVMHCAFYNNTLSFKNQDCEFTTAPCVSFDTEEEREQWNKLYSFSWMMLLFSIASGLLYIDYDRLQYFKPGTTLEDVKLHFHLTDEEIQALEDFQ